MGFACDVMRSALRELQQVKLQRAAELIAAECKYGTDCVPYMQHDGRHRMVYDDFQVIHQLAGISYS